MIICIIILIFGNVTSRELHFCFIFDRLLILFGSVPNCRPLYSWPRKTRFWCGDCGRSLWTVDPFLASLCMPRSASTMATVAPDPPCGCVFRTVFLQAILLVFAVVGADAGNGNTFQFQFCPTWRKLTRNNGEIVFLHRTSSSSSCNNEQTLLRHIWNQKKSGNKTGYVAGKGVRRLSYLT